jgi:pimeloyl-ACP methyl ester carboxylesterase
MAAMAIVCGKPQPDSPENTEKRREWVRSAQRPGGLAKFFDLMADTLVGPTAQRQHPEIRTRARAMMEATSLDAMIAVQQGLAARPDSVGTLRTIQVPVCAIAGAEDRSSTPPEMQVVADQAPRAEFHVVSDAGHYAPLEQPRTVAEILGKFLRQHSARKPDRAGPIL